MIEVGGRIKNISGLEKAMCSLTETTAYSKLDFTGKLEILKKYCKYRAVFKLIGKGIAEIESGGYINGFNPIYVDGKSIAEWRQFELDSPAKIKANTLLWIIKLD